MSGDDINPDISDKLRTLFNNVDQRCYVEGSKNNINTDDIARIAPLVDVELDPIRNSRGTIGINIDSYLSGKSVTYCETDIAGNPLGYDPFNDVIYINHKAGMYTGHSVLTQHQAISADLTHEQIHAMIAYEGEKRGVSFKHLSNYDIEDAIRLVVMNEAIAHSAAVVEEIEISEIGQSGGKIEALEGRVFYSDLTTLHYEKIIGVKAHNANYASDGTGLIAGYNEFFIPELMGDYTLQALNIYEKSMDQALSERRPIGLESLSHKELEWMAAVPYNGEINPFENARKIGMDYVDFDDINARFINKMTKPMQNLIQGYRDIATLHNEDLGVVRNLKEHNPESLNP